MGALLIAEPLKDVMVIRGFDGSIYGGVNTSARYLQIQMGIKQSARYLPNKYERVFVKKKIHTL